jgi:hypothetical protein
MTIAELRKKPVEMGKHLFRLKSPSGIEFIMNHEDIKKAIHTTVDLSRCEIIGEGMQYSDAVAWANTHVLSSEQQITLDKELSITQQSQ